MRPLSMKVTFFKLTNHWHMRLELCKCIGPLSSEYLSVFLCVCARQYAGVCHSVGFLFITQMCPYGRAVSGRGNRQLESWGRTVSRGEGLGGLTHSCAVDTLHYRPSLPYEGSLQCFITLFSLTPSLLLSLLLLFVCPLFFSGVCLPVCVCGPVEKK